MIAQDTIDSDTLNLHPGHKMDLWGYLVNTSSDSCIDHINSHYLQVLSYGTNQKIIHKAVEHDHNCALALALSAVFSSKSNSKDAFTQLAAAKGCLANATDYEKMIVAAAEALVEGHYDAAIKAYSRVLERFPKDLVSLKRVQVLCFYRGKSNESLRLAQKVLPVNKSAPYMHGMLAFSLLETQRFDEADEAARKALLIERTDQWAQHALCHVLQYRCLFHEAILFMERNKKYWNDCCSFMYSHNWWHLSLLYMDWGCSHALDKVVDIYDLHIWPARCRDLGGSVQVSLNALGLLLRLELRGFVNCVKARIFSVAEQLRDPLLWHKELLLDILTIWALAYVGQSSASQDLLKQVQQRVRSLTLNEQGSLKMFLKLAESMYEYGKGNLEAVFNILGPSFDASELKVIGASDEQLDVFQEMLCIAALRSGYFQHVSAIVQQRATTFQGSPFVWEVLAEYYNTAGMMDKAQKARSHASTIKDKYLESISSLEAQLSE